MRVASVVRTVSVCVENSFVVKAGCQEVFSMLSSSAAESNLGHIVLLCVRALRCTQLLTICCMVRCQMSAVLSYR